MSNKLDFLHSFAVKKLEKYKLELKEHNIPFSEDSHIFVTYARGKGSKMEIIDFEDASLVAWQDLEKKRFSPQDMRDMLQGALENARVSPNIASPLLGHKVKGVDQHYSNHEIDEFLHAYLDALPWMVPQTVEGVKAETEKKLEADKKVLTNLKFENSRLKENVNTLTVDQQSTKNEVAFLKKYVFAMGSVIESKEDVEKLQEFLEKMRKQKENQNQLSPEDE